MLHRKFKWTKPTNLAFPLLALTVETIFMIAGLHGLRGLMAIFVMVYHFAAPIFPDKITPGNLGHAVDVFFCLSGYVLSTVYSKLLPFDRDSIIEFAKNRIARIVPLAYLSTLILYGLHVAIHQLGLPINNPLDISILNLAANLLFLDTNIPSFSSYGAKWSISNEMVAYFFIFPLTFLIGRLNKLSIIVLLLAIYITQIIYFDILRSLGYLFSRCIPSFIAGCTLYYLIKPSHKERPPNNFEFHILSWLLGIGGFYLFFCGDDRYNALFSSMIVIFALLKEGNERWFLNSKTLSYCGDISYSLYLLHGIIFLGVAGLLKFGPLASTYKFWILAPIALTILISHISFRLYELPARNYIKRIL